MNEIPEVWQRILFEYENAPSRRVTLRIARANPDVAEYLASQPDAPLDLLEELSLVVAPEIIARAPNASMELLGRVGPKAPQAVLENPAILLFSLESPEKFQALLGQMVDGLLQMTDPPSVVFRSQYINNIQTAIRALAHPNVPQELVIEMAGHYADEVRGFAIEHRLLPKCFKLLAKDHSYRYSYDASEAHWSKALTEEEMLTACNGPMWAQSMMASTRNLPISVYERLSYSSDVGVQYTLIHNPSTPVEVLQNFVGCSDAEMQRLLVHNPKTPTEVIDDFVVRGVYIEETLGHSNLSESSRNKILQGAIKTYQNGGSYTFLASLLLRSDIPVSLLETYALDTNKALRAAVAHNPRTPARYLEQFAADSSVEIRAAVASRKDLPEKLKEVLFVDKITRVRAALAMNPSISQAMMTKLSTDKVVAVRASLAKNHNLARVLISKLVLDHAEEVVEAVRHTHSKFLRK